MFATSSSAAGSVTGAVEVTAPVDGASLPVRAGGQHAGEPDGPAEGEGAAPGHPQPAEPDLLVHRVLPRRGAHRIPTR